MPTSLAPPRHPSALAVLVLGWALAASGTIQAAQRPGAAPGATRGAAQEPAAPVAEDPPAAAATAAPFTVRCRWRSEKSGDAHARELARVLAAVAAAAADAGLTLSADVQLTLDVYDGPRELERATAALTKPDVVRTSGAVRETARGAVHLALRPRIADRMHARFGTSPFLLRRASHEGARLLVDTWLRGEGLALDAADAWAAECVARALAEEGLRSAARSVAAPDEVATSHGLVLLARALAGGAEPLELLTAAEERESGHGEAYGAADAARLAVGVGLLAPGAVDGGALGLLRGAARPGALLAEPVNDEPSEGATARDAVASEGSLDPARRAALRELVRAAAAWPAKWEEVTPGTATWPALLGPVDPALGGDAPVVDPGGLVQWSLPRVDALALATEPLAGAHYVITGTFEPLPLDGTTASQADIAFADQGGGDRILCVFNTREGTWVLKRDPATGEYTPIVGDESLRPAAGQVNTFELRVEFDTIVVALNGRPMSAGRASGLDLAGRYGVGAHSGSTVIWRGVRALSPE
jgi:hypothetical protein